MIERDASMISALTAQAQAEISQYAAREGSDFELLVHADAQSRGGEDDDEVRLDDLDQDLGTEDGEGEEVGEGGLEEEGQRCESRGRSEGRQGRRVLRPCELPPSRLLQIWQVLLRCRL